MSQKPPEPLPDKDQRQWWIRGRVVVGIIALWVWFTRTANRRQHELAEKSRAQERSLAAEARQEERRRIIDAQQEQTLQAYLEWMTDLLLNKGLRTAETGDEVRTVAHARTHAVLRRLDGQRITSVVRFLVDAKLVEGRKPIISLEHAYLREADLSDLNLNEANLMSANLERATLQRTKLFKALLVKANLKGANLRAATLKDAILVHANLEGANLKGAYLSGANLSTSILIKASLEWASLIGAKLIGANLQRANLQRANLQKASLSRTDSVAADLAVPTFKGRILEGLTSMMQTYLKLTFKEQTLQMLSSLKGTYRLQLPSVNLPRIVSHASS